MSENEILNIDLDFDLGIDLLSEKQEKQKEEKPKTVKSLRAGKRHLTRKYVSETALENALPWHFEYGDCFHCISFGDVDSFSYFKAILKQQHIKYAILSTWCMAGDDVSTIESYIKRGLVDRVDFYVGEIFNGSYTNVYNQAIRLVKLCNGRCAVFRNHSKVMVLFGDRFNAVIESSANINTNPRCGNTVITIDKGLAEFYKEFFDEIIPFNQDDCKGWAAYKLENV